MFCSILSWDIIYSDWCFSRFTLVPAGKLRDITLITSLALFFADLLQSIIHQTFHYSALWSLDTPSFIKPQGTQICAGIHKKPERELLEDWATELFPQLQDISTENEDAGFLHASAMNLCQLLQLTDQAPRSNKIQCVANLTSNYWQRLQPIIPCDCPWQYSPSKKQLAQKKWRTVLARDIPLFI